MSAEHSGELRPNVVCKDETKSFTGERTEWRGNVVVSKHASAHTLSKMANYVEKLPVQHIVTSTNNVIRQTYRWTISQYFEICTVGDFRTYIRFRNCECWCLLNKSSVCCY